jgi:hypothetical protein
MSSKIEERKNRLLKASDEYEELINEDITIVSDFAREWGGKLLLIGGAFLISYLGVRAIIRKKHDEGGEKEMENRSSRLQARNIMIKSLSDKAALVLLALAREYIVKLLSDTSEEKDARHT